MATANSVSIQWIPEDDLLLKTAVEGGASLEALAKGAVQFSRRYTLRELRERWYSLLYDPDISAQASAHIFELEISGVSPASKLNRAENNCTGNKEVSRKRKLESIRRKYYAMRKRFRSEFFSNSDLGFFEPNYHELSGPGADFHKQVMLDGNPLGQNCMLGDNISDHLGLQEEDLDILRHAFPETIRDIAVASGATNVSQAGCSNSFEDHRQNKIMGGYGFDENVTSSITEGRNLEVNIKNRKTPLTLRKNSIHENPNSSPVGFEGRQQFSSPNSDGFSSFQTMVFASDQPHLRHWQAMQDVSASVPVSMSLQDKDQVAEDMIPNDVEGKESSSAAYAGEFADPDSLLNLSNEDEILLVDEDEKHAENKCCIDDISSVLQDSNKDGKRNDVAKVEHETVTVPQASLVPDPTENPAALVAVSSVDGDQQINHNPEVDVPSKSTSASDFTELSNGKICCTLNTEDTEIPCNDDIFLLIHPSTSFGYSATQPITTVSTNACAAAHEKDNVQAVNLSMKAKDSTKVLGWPQKVGIHSLPESRSVHQLVGSASKTEIHDPTPQALLPGFAKTTIGDSSKGRSLYANPKVSSDSLADKEVPGVDMKVRANPATVAETIRSTEGGFARTALPESAVDSSVSDPEESLIDDDVPYFSDVEAMILDMDLDPYDPDSRISRQVPSYQYEDTKRTIIRLEQGARSCLQRAMTSQGALAILYGRHLRHYIRKPEVLLGRSTDDVDVDIDLRKEGRANKISRRQAIIKMEADGSFFIRNLGKSSLSVNGTTVATGQLLNLTSSCLIEIKGMSFVFEINQGYVRKHLGSFCLKNKGKTDWSAEDES
ncbi:Microspherule protein 1 [Sesamum alatum]|uniref:Microspherule protein 1 n=1 Tax=Sesamum alatum TaxID=300844 RepID=A0AAE1XSZ6_9LAMI|nr:Microspherule protein 1 [Sesamum alatum]